MKWGRLIPILFASSLVFGAPQSQKVKPIYDFSKGLDTYHSSLSLPDGYVQSSLNGFFDSQGPFTKRSGYQVIFSTKTYSFQQEWTYTDPNNNSWIIVRASDTLIANSLSGSASVKVATVSVNNVVSEANAFGNAYFTDQTQGVYYWNGSSVTFVAGSPLGSLITSFHNRLWVSGAAVPNGNQIYGSALYNGLLWTANVNPNDPVQLTAGLQDNFDNVTAMYVFLDTMYIGKHYAIYGLYGFDQTNFQISQITQECGILDPNSIQTLGGTLKFVSLRGVEQFDGYTCSRISDPVKNLVDPAISAGFSQQSWVLQQASDWNSGTFNPTANLNSAVVAPALVLSTGTHTDSVASDWNAGSLTNLVVSGNSIGINYNDSGNVTNPDFESSFSGNWTSSGSGTFSRVTTTSCQFPTGNNCENGSACAEMTYSGGTTSFYFEALDPQNRIIQQVSVPANNDCTWRQLNVSSVYLGSQQAGKRTTFRFHANNGSQDTYLSTSDSYIWGGTISFWYKNLALASPGLSTFDFDNVQNGSSTITTGSFVSQVVDTGITKTQAQVTNFNTTVLDFSPTLVFQSSPDNSSWADLGTSSGTDYLANRYLRYLSTFTVNSGDALSSLNAVTFQWTASSGAFKSPIHMIPSINTFGNFPVTDSLNGGNISFSICSSTNSNMSVPLSCASQNPNAQITVSTGVTGDALYVNWFATFTVTGATQTPTLNSGTVQWFSGTKPVPMASAIFDTRYWLSLTTTTTDTANDAVLVYGKTGAWSLLSIHAGGFTQYKGSLYHSDSNPTGSVYIDNTGTTDNGSNINSYIITKDFKGEDLNADEYFNSAYMSMDPGNSNCTGTVYYFLDHNEASPFTLSTVQQSEFVNSIALKIPFSLGTNQNFGHTIAFEYQENDACGLNLYGFSPYYFERPVQ